MTELWAAIALLLCLTSGFILWAWLRPLPPSVVPNNRHHLVVDLYRIKQKELDQELESAQISRGDYDLRLAEMQRTLLLETADTKAAPAPSGSSSRAGGLSLLFVALVVPAAGLLTYLELGAYNSLEQNINLQTTRSITQSAASLQVLIVNLEQELEQKPNNPEGWYLLANSYMQGEQTLLGINAFEQALKYVQSGSRQEAALLGQYAQALFFHEGEFSLRVNEAIANALEKNPNDVSALSLLGIQAFESENYNAAIQFWQRALPNAGEGQGKASLQAGIDSAQQLQNGGKEIELGISVPINVSLANGLSLPSPSATLFVYAKQVGQRMPLFAIKLNPNNLPLEVLLTDAMALQQGTKLADYKTLHLSAHVAMAGVPGQKAGDLLSPTVVINVDEASAGQVNLTIDQILK